MVTRSKSPRLFFTEEEKNRIVEAIRQAERRTSGEIRVFLERRARGEVLERSKRIFDKLGMTRTERRNGVLIYVSLTRHAFAILGDQGIHKRVGEEFWRSLVRLVEQYFGRGDFVEGLVAGIREIGIKFQTYFPQEEGDLNELPDDVAG